MRMPNDQNGTRILCSRVCVCAKAHLKRSRMAHNNYHFSFSKSMSEGSRMVQFLAAGHLPSKSKSKSKGTQNMTSVLFKTPDYNIYSSGFG